VNVSVFVDSDFSIPYSVIPSLSVNRNQMASASVNGYLVFAGGFTVPGNQQSARVDIFRLDYSNPSLPTFVRTTGDLPAARHGAVAIPWGNGRVALVGGYRQFGGLEIDYVEASSGNTGTIASLNGGFPDGPVTACAGNADGPTYTASSLFVASIASDRFDFYSANTGARTLTRPPSSSPIKALVSYSAPLDIGGQYSYSYPVTRIVIAHGGQVAVWVMNSAAQTLLYQTSPQIPDSMWTPLALVGGYSNGLAGNGVADTFRLIVVGSYLLSAYVDNSSPYQLRLVSIPMDQTPSS